MKHIVTAASLIFVAAALCGCATSWDRSESDDSYYEESDMHEMIRRTGGEQALETTF